MMQFGFELSSPWLEPRLMLTHLLAVSTSLTLEINAHLWKVMRKVVGSTGYITMQ